MSIPIGATHVFKTEYGQSYFMRKGGLDSWYLHNPGDWVRQRDIDDSMVSPINSDTVNSPTHYTKGDIECIDAIKSAVAGKSGIEAVYVANVIKYLWRYEEKGGIESVKKADWYLKKLLEELR